MQTMALTPKINNTQSAQKILEPLKMKKMMRTNAEDYEDSYDADDDRAVYVGLTYPDNVVCDDHIKLWKMCVEPNPNAYSIMQTTHANNRETGQRVLLFSTKEEMFEFDEWWNSYTARFQENEWKETFLPRLREGQEIRGHIIYHTNTRDTGNMYQNPGYAFVDDWKWIVNNTNGKVYFNSEFWVFEESSELLAFKLKGDSTKYYLNDNEDDIPF